MPTDLVRCRLTGTADELRGLLGDLPAADFGCRPVAVRVVEETEGRAGDAEPRVAAQVLLPRDEVAELRSRRAAVEIEEVEDVTASAEAAAREVSPGGRFAARGELPTGLGRRARPDTEGRAVYSTAQEIEDGLAALAAAHPTAAQLLAVPNPTHGGRVAHVLRIGTGPGAGSRDAIAILGGVHSREWVPPEACLALAADLLGAYADGDGLAYGGAVFDAAEVRALVQSLDLYVFACVNPDGRVHSQTVAPLWRKNRRPGTGGGCPGVDVNRNFDFLWDHTAHFAPDAGVATSSDPCNDTYRGPSAASEPETRNVVWLLDSYPIRWLVDVHSAVPVVLHPWGSDTNQGTDPDMTFRNPAYDAVRGRVGDAVGEYITARDGGVGLALAQEMAAGALAVRGTVWPVEQAMTLYPTSGASDDYAFSRNFSDAAKRQVLGWTIECGSSFQPPWAEAQQVAAETCAALLRFAAAARRLTTNSS